MWQVARSDATLERDCFGRKRVLMGPDFSKLFFPNYFFQIIFSKLFFLNYFPNYFANYFSELTA